MFQITDEEGAVQKCTFAELVEANCDYEPLLEWAKTAAVGNEFQGGGGAAPMFTIRRLS